MKEFPDTAEKTSRRRFTKTIASALVAAPVISSLSSCAQNPESDNRGISATPSPQPSPPTKEDRGINPPVIIDGGSLTLLAPGKLMRIEDDQTPPKHYDFKYKQKNDGAFGPIKGIHIIDDYADEVLREYTLGSGESLQVHIWIARVTRQTGSEDDDTDAADYEPIATNPPLPPPNIIIQGGRLEFRMDRKANGDGKKVFKRRGKNQKRYLINDWDVGNTPFRFARVKVLVNPNQIVKYNSDDHPNDVEKGFRILLLI